MEGLCGDAEAIPPLLASFLSLAMEARGRSFKGNCDQRGTESSAAATKIKEGRFVLEITTARTQLPGTREKAEPFISAAADARKRRFSMPQSVSQLRDAVKAMSELILLRWL